MLAEAGEYLMGGLVQCLAFQLVAKCIYHRGVQVLVIFFCCLRAMSHIGRLRQSYSDSSNASFQSTSVAQMRAAVQTTRPTVATTSAHEAL